MKRGEVWWADLPAPSGSGPGFRRPVLIVSADAFNRSRIATVIAAVVSSNEALAEAPGNVRVSGKSAGLERPSVVNVSQLLTLDRRDLDTKSGRLDARQLAAVDRGLRLALGLG